MQPQHTTPTTKTCTKCGEIKPATTEFFHRDKSRRGGLSERCKECKCAHSRTWYDLNQEYAHRKHAAYRAAHQERLNEQGRAYHAINKVRRNQESQAWYAVHKEDSDFKEKRKEYAHSWNIVNRERIRESHQRYREGNQELYRAATRRRAARRRSASGNHTAEDVHRQYQGQKGKCYYCHIEVGDTYHVDHVVPLSRGGSNGPENIVIACPTCNMSKHDKLPSEWPQGGRLL